MTTLNLQVGANADDVYHQIRDGVHGFGSNIVLAGASRHPAPADYIFLSVLRFAIVAIPQGATISAASLTLTARTNRAEIVVRTNISAEDVDNADTIDDCPEVDALVRTAAVVPWDNIPAWTNNVEYTSPDMAAVIQEIVDRPGWTSGNALNIIWEDDGSDMVFQCFRRAWAHEGDPNKAAKLDITYIVEGSAALSGAGALSSLSLVQVMASAGLSGAGALSASSLVQVLGSAGLSGVGALSASSLVLVVANAALSGLGTLVADAAVIPGGPGVIVTGAAALSAVGALRALGYNIIPYHPGMCWPRADLFCPSHGDIRIFLVPGVGLLYVRRGEEVPAGLERSLGGFVP